MELYWLIGGFVLVALVLIALLARMLGNSRRRQLRKQLGLPVDSRLTAEQSRAFQTFEDTDAKLRKSFPTMSDTQRQAMARDVLREKGLLPKKRR